MNTTTVEAETVEAACERVAAGIQEVVNAEFARLYPNLEPEKVSIHPRKKFLAIDIGTSGAWLVEKDTGEIFNIQGYGRPDRNKKRKADIGNIRTVEPERMCRLRHNYLR